jgi:hypothetical protein
VIVNLAGNPLICFHNILDFMVNEEVEGVDMLFDQALDFQKRWQEVPFVLQTVRETCCAVNSACILELY